MKLTIIRLENFSDQTGLTCKRSGRSIPLPLYRLTITTASTPRVLTKRLLAAVRVTLSGTEGALDSLRVREVTRRRGVGQYLLEEVLRNNPGVSCWWMADAGVEDRGVMTAFMRALGFTAQQGGWEKR